MLKTKGTETLKEIGFCPFTKEIIQEEILLSCDQITVDVFFPSVSFI